MKKTMYKTMEKNKKITIVTHGANYHPDDLFGVATLSIYFKSKSQPFTIKRSLDKKVWDKADILLDVGSVHDEKTERYDHHQIGGAGERDTKIPYASFGLIWKKYGKKICDSADVSEYVDKRLVAPLDASDNGVTLYDIKNPDAHPVQLIDYIDAECILEKNKPKEKQDFDKSFKKLLPFAERVINLYIEKGKSKVSAKKEIQKIFKKQIKPEIFVSDKFIPYDFEEYPQVLFYVYKDLRGGWSAKTIKLHASTYESRKSFPESWRGKRDSELEKVTGVPGAVFCHNSGFLVVAKTKEAVLELAHKALD
jgi:uncharacterized UPF0160 family protein